jgi:hypothetical protein
MVRARELGSGPVAFPCVWLESRGSGVAPLPRLFGWGAAGAERLPGAYSLNLRVGSAPQNSRNGAAPLQFLLSRLPLSRISLSSESERPRRALQGWRL